MTVENPPPGGRAWGRVAPVRKKIPYHPAGRSPRCPLPCAGFDYSPFDRAAGVLVFLSDLAQRQRRSPLHTVLDTVAVFGCQTVARNIKNGSRAGAVCSV